MCVALSCRTSGCIHQRSQHQHRFTQCCKCCSNRPQTTDEFSCKQLRLVHLACYTLSAVGFETIGKLNACWGCLSPGYQFSCDHLFIVQDERMRLSEQLAAAREDLRRAEAANRARAETQSQVRRGGTCLHALFCPPCVSPASPPMLGSKSVSCTHTWPQQHAQMRQSIRSVACTDAGPQQHAQMRQAGLQPMTPAAAVCCATACVLGWNYAFLAAQGS